MHHLRFIMIHLSSAHIALSRQKWSNFLEDVSYTSCLGKSSPLNIKGGYHTKMSNKCSMVENILYSLPHINVRWQVHRVGIPSRESIKSVSPQSVVALPSTHKIFHEGLIVISWLHVQIPAGSGCLPLGRGPWRCGWWSGWALQGTQLWPAPAE